jgi:tRNA 2-selenouridine synthase
MFRVIDYEDIDKNRIDENYIIIDLRSPNEYESATIPRAINIPIFSNKERELIGTVYKNESIDKAKKIGVQVVSEKLPSIYEEVSKLDKEYNNLVFFCSRGGYRSSSLVALFKSIGINAIKLDNGYKGYRKYINDNLPSIVKDIQFVVLYGNTGTGKTDILKELEYQGMDVLDLEGCANHRGSLLGSVGLGKQNSQKMFESLVYDALSKRKTNLVFVEGESRRIGRDMIPIYIYEAMNDGIGIKIQATMENRVHNLSKDYVHDTDNELISSLNNLRKYLGDNNIDKYIELIENHGYKEVIEELMIKYYDPMYEHKNRNYKKIFNNNNAEETAKEIIKWSENIKSSK